MRLSTAFHKLLRAITWVPLAASVLTAEPVENWSKVRSETFTQVWTTVNESYHDPEFGGVDWVAIKAVYQPRLVEAEDNPSLRYLLQGMLNELGQTHFAIVPKEAAVFTPEERNLVGTVGATFATTGGEVVVTNIESGSSSSEAGLRNGDIIRRVDGRDVDEVAKLYAETGVTEARKDFYLNQFVSSPLSGPVGTDVEVEVEGVDGTVRTITLKSGMHTGEWSEPLGNMPSFPVEFEAKHDNGVAYLKFNSFSPILMKDIRRFLKTLESNEGLVVDLRGNPGGLILMASGICGWLSADEFSLGRMRMRAGVMNFEVYPQKNAFPGPVAVLIDNGSASTSEVLAAGLQEAGRARVFGETSAGAALPSAFLKLATGDLLQYAIADLTTPKGANLEGVGVKPDEPVSRSRDDIASGRDPVVNAARTWIETARPKPADQP